MDGHENKDTKQYWKNYVKTILELEIRIHRWVQVSTANAKKYKEKHGLLYESGYFYKDVQTGEDMVAYQIDACNEFNERIWSLGLT